MLITSQILHFLKLLAAKHYGTHRSDTQTVNTPGAQGADNGFFGQWFKGQYSAGPAVCARGGGGQGGGESYQGEQQGLTWTHSRQATPASQLACL